MQLNICIVFCLRSLPTFSEDGSGMVGCRAEMLWALKSDI